MIESLNFITLTVAIIGISILSLGGLHALVSEIELRKEGNPFKKES